jgi:hypothetical protein
MLSSSLSFLVPLHLFCTNQGHAEISKTPYGILQGVKEGAAFTQGTWGAAICDSMAPREGELIVKGKSGLCGFASTNLDFLLRQNNIRNVVLGGFLTNCCVSYVLLYGIIVLVLLFDKRDTVGMHSLPVLTLFPCFS